MKFIHRVSKGSRYRQIYIPKSREVDFEVGSLVEVRLLKKPQHLHFSKNLKKLSFFKEKLIKDIFGYLSQYPRIKQVFIFGSFLTKGFDYNDIDVLVLIEKENEKFGKDICNKLLEKFNLKLHILVMQKDKLDPILRICPLIRGMLYYFISNKEFELPQKTAIDENHIKFLLMMAEDLLDVDLEEGIEYYNVLRKLITIERFLRNEEITPDRIDFEVERIIGSEKLELLKKNTLMDKYLLEEMKKLMIAQLKVIYKKMMENKNGKKQKY